jgi:UDP-N-acetylglucosamine--N-acetylmuramyl-(pentapeptide) pyrophosphoryl-undecaprenol N-acetylglucosamine transferase
VVSAGGGVLVPDADLTADRLVAESTRLLGDPDRLAKAAAAAAGASTPDAAATLVAMVRAAADPSIATRRGNR